MSSSLIRRTNNVELGESGLNQQIANLPTASAVRGFESLTPRQYGGLPQVVLSTAWKAAGALRHKVRFLSSPPYHLKE